MKFFQIHDIVTDQISKSYDLVLSRHTIQHLKNMDVRDILQNFVSSGSKYVLATNHPYLEVYLFSNYKIINFLLLQENMELDETTKIRMRGVNLFLKPYQLPLPICQHWDAFYPDVIMLWDLRTLAGCQSQLGCF